MPCSGPLLGRCGSSHLRASHTWSGTHTVLLALLKTYNLKLIAEEGVVNMAQNIIPHSRPALDEKEIEAVVDVIKSGHIAQNGAAREFEDRLADFIGTKGASGRGRRCRW